MKVTVKVEGLKQIQDALHDLPKATAKNIMRRVLKSRAQPIADTATKLAPVDTGYLQRSIAVSTKLSRAARKGHKKLSKDGVEVYVGPSGAPRSIMQEFGTIDHPPHPYLRPAWDAHKDELLTNIGKDMWNEIDKAKGRIAKLSLIHI